MAREWCGGKKARCRRVIKVDRQDANYATALVPFGDTRHDLEQVNEQGRVQTHLFCCLALNSITPFRQASVPMLEAEPLCTLRARSCTATHGPF